MTPEEARKELVKVAVGFKLLERGAILRMSDEEYERFVKWLDGEKSQ